MSSRVDSPPAAGKRPNPMADFGAEYDLHINEPARKRQIAKHEGTVETLPASLRLCEPAHMYPDFLAIDTQKKVPMYEVYQGENRYRHKDVPLFTTRGEDGGTRMAYSDAKSAHHVRIIVQPRGKNVPYATAGHAGRMPDPKLNPSDYAVNIVPQTQRPYVKVTLIMERDKDGKPLNTVSIYYHAQVFTRGDGSVGFDLKYGKAEFTRGFLELSERYADIAAADDDIMCLRLDPAMEGSSNPKYGNVVKPVVIGMTKNEQDTLMIKAGIAWKAGTQDKDLTPQENILACMLDDPLWVQFYGKLPDRAIVAPHFDQMRKFCRAVFFATAHKGPFWWYKLASDLEFEDVNFPWAEVEPPCWLVARWRVWYENDTPVKARPIHWGQFAHLEAIPLPDEFVHGNEQRIGLAREVRKSAIHIQYLSSLAKGSVFGKFTSLPNHDSYYISVTVSGLFGGGEKKPIPEYGRQCFTDVRVGGVVYRFNSIVIDDPLHKGGDFTVAAKAISPVPAPKIPNGTSAEIALVFPVNTPAIDRQSAAIVLLQRGQARDHGVHFPSAVLNAPVPNGHKYNWLHDFLVQKGKKGIYDAEIKRANLNEKQQELAELIVAPGPDECLLWGPPGTGKTYTEMAIAKALYLCGIKIICAATSNTAINECLKKFVENPVENFDPLTVTRFAGAISREYAGNECRKNNDGDDAMTATANTITQDEKTSKKAIRLWSDDVETDEDGLMELNFEMIALNAQGSKGSIQDHEYSFASQQHKFIQESGGRLMFGERHTAARRYMQLHQELNSMTKIEGVKAKRKEFKDLNAWFGAIYLKERVKIVFTTNSSSGHGLLRRNFKPEFCIQDEAGQSSLGDASVLLASYMETIRYWLQCGDHKQLAPMATSVGSNEVIEALTRSMFEDKMLAIERGLSIVRMVVLEEQLRMHWSIADWPNKQLYGGNLQNAAVTSIETELDKKIAAILEPLKEDGHWDGKTHVIGVDISNMSVATRLRPIVDIDPSTNKPIVMSKKYAQTMSLHNEMEARAIAEFEAILVNAGVAPKDIKVVVPYKGQLYTVRTLNYSSVVAPEMKDIPVAPLDSCPGSECDVLIVSRVCNDPEDQGNLGFTFHSGKINVERTRAKRWIFYFCNFMGQSKGTFTSGNFINTKKCATYRSMIRDMVDKEEIIAYNNWRTVLVEGKKASYKAFYNPTMGCKVPFKPKPHSAQIRNVGCSEE